MYCHIHVQYTLCTCIKKYISLSNGAKWKLNVHNCNVDGSPRRSETAIFILLLISWLHVLYLPFLYTYFITCCF